MSTRHLRDKKLEPLVDLPSNMKRERVEELFPGAIDALDDDESGSLWIDDAATRLAFEPDVPCEPYVWRQDEGVWRQESDDSE